MSCESPWQRRSGGTVPALVPASVVGSARHSSQSKMPFLYLNQSELSSLKDSRRTPDKDQSEMQRQKTASHSVETPNFEDDTQLTSLSEDHTCDDNTQSLPCDHISENLGSQPDLECESHDKCSSTNENYQDTVQYDSNDELLCNEETENVRSRNQSHDRPSRSRDHSRDDEQMSHDIIDQSANISVEIAGTGEYSDTRNTAV